MDFIEYNYFIKFIIFLLFKLYFKEFQAIITNH